MASELRDVGWIGKVQFGAGVLTTLATVLAHEYIFENEVTLLGSASFIWHTLSKSGWTLMADWSQCQLFNEWFMQALDFEAVPANLPKWWGLGAPALLLPRLLPQRLRSLPAPVPLAAQTESERQQNDARRMQRESRASRRELARWFDALHTATDGEYPHTGRTFWSASPKWDAAIADLVEQQSMRNSGQDKVMTAEQRYRRMYSSCTIPPPSPPTSLSEQMRHVGRPLIKIHSRR